ncbi:MAG TPA: hypothetical protein VKA50_03505 [Gammaproteobacteria bacterium]|nr:hypothetical protein [Gammaproteobacteria bacterium]
MVGAADVNIHRLRLRAPRMQHPRVTASLHTAQWPSAGIDEWLFIRRVAVRTPVARLATAAASEARLQAGAAADGESPGALYAPAVRFTSLAHLLACLTGDLLNGRAAQAWFWQRWAHLFQLPPGTALGRLWQEHAAELPEVTALLAERGCLHRIWQTFVPAEARDLLERVVHTLGLSPSVVESTRPGSTSPAWPSELVSAPLRARWRPVLDGVAVSDARVRLAAALAAIEWRPTRLLDEDAGGFIAAVAADLAGSSSARHPGMARRPRPAPGRTTAGKRRTVVTESPAAGRPIPEDRRQTTRVPRVETDPRVSARPSVSTAQPKDAVQVEGDSPPTLTQQPNVTVKRSGAPVTESPSTDHRTDVTQTEPIDRPGEGPEGFYTPEGGLFLLLNFLERPEARSLIAEHGEMAAMPSGWALLYRLGQALGLSANGTMAWWLAERLELNDVGRLAELPPLPGGTALVALGERLYRQADGSEPLWGAALLRRPALVACTRSHLDVCYPLARASLSVRLVGLDLDPGWLAWLGRVVSFHYVQSPLFEEADPQ